MAEHPVRSRTTADRIWRFEETDEMRRRAEALLATLAVEQDSQPPLGQLGARIAVLRGYDTPEKAKGYLSPELKKIFHPFALVNVERAAARVAEAIIRNEKIAVYGDYDVDGITSVSLFKMFFQSIGFRDFIPFIPRRNEGYGLSNASIKALADEGAKLIITVDCGITSVEEIAYANGLGLTTVVTDHHKPRETLPEAYAIVNPHVGERLTEALPLAGVGVAFFLVSGVKLKLAEFKGRTPSLNTDVDLKDFLDLVALGTIADMAPLTGINRTIVRYGLKLLDHSRNFGIKALKDVANIGKRMSTWDIAFKIAPRLNASGRMSDANLAVKLLTEKNDYGFALRLAREISEDNERRKVEEGKILKGALDRIERERELDESAKMSRAIVISSRGWHKGIIGIVASRLVERYSIPAIVISVDNGIGKGSGRSIGAFNLFDALNRFSDRLLTFGGHSLAAGLTIAEDKIDEFAASFKEFAADHLTEEDIVPSMRIDCLITLAEITEQLTADMHQMEPFGIGNLEPVFAATSMTVERVDTIKGGHLKLRVSSGGVAAEAFGFGMGSLAVTIGPSIDLAFTIDRSRYAIGRINLIIRDIRAAKEGAAEVDGNSPLFPVDSDKK